jgi:uncharacterized protein
MTFIKLTLVVFGVFYAAALSGMYLMQRDLQYFPDRRDPSPEAVGLSNVTRIPLATVDKETVVLWWSPPPPGRPVVLFFHGNGGAMSDRADRLAFYQSRGFGAAFLSYRGYGGSTGTPSETGLMLDANAAYAFVRGKGIPADHIVLVGESLGSGVAVQIAARHPVSAVVLEAPYSAAVDIAARAYPWAPVRWLMKDTFKSRTYINDVRAPLLILHGDRDQVIPQSFGKTLFDLANDPKTFVSLGPVGHEALFDPDTWAKGADFIDGLSPSTP